jgi:hypothetical protein
MRRIGRRLLLGLLAAAILAAVLVAVLRLSGSVLATGPLGPPGNHDSNCLPGRPKNSVGTEGNQPVTNSGHDTIVIDRLVLASPHHLKLTGAYLVPGRGLVGTWLSFPPPAGKVDRNVQWNRANGLRERASRRARPSTWYSASSRPATAPAARQGSPLPIPRPSSAISAPRRRNPKPESLSFTQTAKRRTTSATPAPGSPSTPWTPTPPAPTTRTDWSPGTDSSHTKSHQARAR